MESTRRTDGVLEKRADVEAQILRCIHALKNALEEDFEIVMDEYHVLVLCHSDPKAFRQRQGNSPKVLFD